MLCIGYLLELCVGGAVIVHYYLLANTIHVLQIYGAIAIQSGCVMAQ